MSFVVGPRTKIVHDLDRAEEERLAKIAALRLGYPVDEARKIAREAVTDLEADEHGYPVYVLAGGVKVAELSGGRRARVQEIHRRRQLLTHGPDPEETVRQGLRDREYNDNEIATVLTTAGIGRDDDGGVRYRGLHRGDDLVMQAIDELGERIEAARRDAAIPPEVLDEVTQRLGRTSI